ncbi:MAG: metallophosphoesterase [Alteromonadaceae bacterium]|nr:metallophosphoesterase [Alteromonadaceae bacterium]
MKKSFVVAQITDSHLFSDIDRCHHQANVYQNLLKVLQALSENSAVDCIVFTGDLTQDHTEGSYQRFCQAVAVSGLKVPIYYLAGNHDEPKMMTKHLSQEPFSNQRVIESENWQIILLDSKTDTPKGKVNTQELTWLQEVINPDKSQLLMMHHHPVNVGYFIDKHPLQDKVCFWQVINKYSSIQMIACGHVHRAMSLFPSGTVAENELLSGEFVQSVPVYTCPATSIEFDHTSEHLKATSQGPGYRLWFLDDNKSFVTEVNFIW